MAQIHIDFSQDPHSFENPGITMDPDGSLYAPGGPGLCICTEEVQISLSWDQAESLKIALNEYFTPDEEKEATA